MSSPGSAATAPPPARAEAPATAHDSYRARLRNPSPAMLFAGCLVLAIISVIALSWPPSSDPWAWIDWGQEIASRVVSPRIGLSLAGGPSWKPFPVIFTSVFGLFGSAAPHLWLVVSRTAGLLALVGAYRVARRLGGPVAGILAALGLCLVQDALFYFARGASEPIVVAATLWAIDFHLSGSPRMAYFIGFVGALNRPEFGPFLALYAVYLWVRFPGARTYAITLLVLVPIAWFGAPALISGNPFQAGNAALGGKGSPGSLPAELRSGFGLMTVPTVVLAAIGLLMAYLRREMVLVWLGVGAIAWAIMEGLITQVAYGLPRYLLPAGAVACVLAAMAIVWLAEEAGRRVSWSAVIGGGRRISIAGVLTGVALVALTLPWTLTRAEALGTQGGNANQAASYISQLFTAVDRAGGRTRVLPCVDSAVAVNHTIASALAWKLQVPERRVHPSLRGTGFVFSAPHNTTTGTTPPIAHRSARAVRLIVQIGPWRVLEVTRKGASSTPHCARGRYTAA